MAEHAEGSTCSSSGARRKRAHVLVDDAADDTDDGDVDEREGRPKKKYYPQAYLTQYSKLPGIKPSSKGASHAYCTYCKTHFDIGHSGKYDIERHQLGKKHMVAATAAKRNRPITDFIPQQNISGDIDRKVIRAEAMYTDLITELNLPLSVADKFNKVHKNAFPDSEIARRYQCARDKTTAIVKLQGREESNGVGKAMKERPFAIATDGSSDAKLKQYPVVVTTANLSDGVEQKLLGIPCLPLQDKSTGKNIANLVVNQVNKYEVPWTNCISFGTDNAPVMTGRNNGVIAFLREKHPVIYMSGCPCHLIHLAGEKATATLPFTPVKLDEALVDTYYFFDKSSNRLGELERWQQFHEVEHQKILKHVKTRWLSTGPCIDRILENWEALKNLFRDEAAKLPDGDDTDGRVHRMFKFYRSPTNRLLCLFVRNIMKVFETVNTRLQQTAPLIHVLRRDLHKLMRDLLLRYKVPGALRGKTVTDVNIDTELGQRIDEELLIGDAARDFINRKNEVGLREKRIEDFYSGVRKFFITACTYVKEKLPLNESLLRHAEVADVTQRINAVQFDDLRYFLDRYPSLLPQGCGREEIEVEFAEYQAEATIPTAENGDMDKTWVIISKMEDGGGVPKYRNLASVMLGILTIPHSNAECERIFSAVRQNKTWKRGSLTGDTIEALILAKSRPGQAESRVYSTEQLKDMKSAYYQTLKK